MNDYDAEHVEYLKAERDRLRAELADLERALDGDEYVQRMQAAEAAIARVRELCAKAYHGGRWPAVAVAAILHVLDGETE